MSRYLPLSPQGFHELRWQRFRDYRHAAQLHLVPLAAPEISRAAARLPLAFARDKQGRVSLCLLTGLREGVNHCIDADHRWQAGYTPAWLRGHPFRLLAAPNKQAAADQRVLCVDIESPWVGQTGEAFFDGETMTASVKEVFGFLGTLAKQYRYTDRAVALLDDNGLLAPWGLVDHQGQPIRGLLRLDEQKLASVTPEVLSALHHAGALPIAYTQAISTHQLNALKTLAGQHDADYRNIDLDAVFGEDDDELNFNFGG